MVRTPRACTLQPAGEKSVDLWDLYDAVLRERIENREHPPSCQEREKLENACQFSIWEPAFYWTRLRLENDTLSRAS
jgi:hypothetical protein